MRIKAPRVENRKTQCHATVQPDASPEVRTSAEVVLLGTAAKLTLGRPGRHSRDGKYFFN